jgi:LPPG:FO 2-phospho-L-lactate transferase
VTTIVGLGGGIGASRLWRALLSSVPPEDVTLVVNTGEDIWMHGLRVCPDLDTVLYALSGRQDTQRGWGVKDETWHAMDTLAEFGERPWFNLGDRDLAVHLFRSGRLRDNVPLSHITNQLTEALGLRCRVVPMTDDPVTTYVHTTTGKTLHYQEFLVREHCQPDITEVVFDGAAQALCAEDVLATIRGADIVVIGPSNPVASLGPMLALPGMRDALASVRHRTVVVTPIVESVQITDPGEANRARSREKLLAAKGFKPGVVGAAAYYADVADNFVIDAADSHLAQALDRYGLRVMQADTLLHLGANPTPLLDAILAVG